MTIVNVKAFISALVGPKVLDRGYIVATPWIGNSPAIQVAGENIHFPRAISIQITNGNLANALNIPPLVIPYKLVVSDLQSGESLEKFVLIPDQTSVDYEDLVEVDPFSFEPSDTSIAAWEAAIAEVEAIRIQANIEVQEKIDALGPVTDAQLAAIAADPDSDFSEQVSTNLDMLVGNRLTVLEMTRGSAAARDGYFGIPMDLETRVALANKQPLWFNTEYGWYESYYTVVGSAGLNVQGLITGSPSGWYPVGPGPTLYLVASAQQTLTAGNTFGNWATPGVGRSTRRGGTAFFSLAAGVITLPIAGRYDSALTLSVQQGAGTGRMAITRNGLTADPHILNEVRINLDSSVDTMWSMSDKNFAVAAGDTLRLYALSIGSAIFFQSADGQRERPGSWGLSYVSPPLASV